MQVVFCTTKCWFPAGVDACRKVGGFQSPPCLWHAICMCCPRNTGWTFGTQAEIWSSLMWGMSFTKKLRVWSWSLGVIELCSGSFFPLPASFFWSPAIVVEVVSRRKPLDSWVARCFVRRTGKEKKSREGRRETQEDGEERRRGGRRGEKEKKEKKNNKYIEIAREKGKGKGSQRKWGRKKKVFSFTEVYDVTSRRSFQNLEKWMDEVAKYSQGSEPSYALVGTKMDLHTRLVQEQAWALVHIG